MFGDGVGRWGFVVACGLVACQGPGGPLDGQTVGDMPTSTADDGDGSGSGADDSTAGDASTSTAMGGDADSSSAGPGTDDSTGDPADCGVEGAWCTPIPACDAEPPAAGTELDWNHTTSTFIVASGGNNHRGRDMFYNEGDTQWVLAKFAYGPTDWDLQDEQVDVFVLRNCEGDWESLGSHLTTTEGDHATVEGVEDTGGRLYLQLSGAQTLGPGRHRVHMIVRGDGTRTDAYIEVVPPGTPIFVADIDGTLTTAETEEFTDLLTGAIPDVNEGAPEALQALAAAGYHPVYVTARPEFLGRRTREFIALRGLPQGIVHTTLSFTGALGSAAVDYKNGELEALAARGLHPDWVFGNTDSDGDAYDLAAVQPLDHRIFFQHPDPHGGRTIDSYVPLVGEFLGLANLCPGPC